MILLWLVDIFLQQFTVQNLISPKSKLNEDSRLQGRIEPSGSSSTSSALISIDIGTAHIKLIMTLSLQMPVFLKHNKENQIGVFSTGCLIDQF